MKSLLKALAKVVRAAYEYPEALGGHPKVKEAIEEFRALEEPEKTTRPLLYWLLGSGTPEYKMSKLDSDYVKQSSIPNKTCDNCEYAYTKTVTLTEQNPDHICSQIAGRIHAKGWCRLWALGAPSDRHEF